MGGGVHPSTLPLHPIEKDFLRGSCCFCFFFQFSLSEFVKYLTLEYTEKSIKVNEHYDRVISGPRTILHNRDPDANMLSIQCHNDAIFP